MFLRNPARLDPIPFACVYRHGYKWNFDYTKKVGLSKLKLPLYL